MQAKIINEQNTAENIHLLVAQAQLYTEAKRIRLIRLFISASLAVAAPIVAILAPQAGVIMTALGGVWTLATYFPFRGLQREKARQAAKIQEQFDVKLFHLPWNAVRAGAQVKPEITHAAVRASKENPQRFQDWYSDPGTLPYPLDVLLCQRANTVWDWRLRRHYAARIAWLTAGVLAIDAVISLLLRQTFSDFLLSLFFPTLPALAQGAETFLAHRETAAEKEELAHRIEALWEIGIHNPQTVTIEQCRQIQDRIYDLRADGPLVPDRWYRWLRDLYQADMDATATDLRAQAEQALANTNSGGHRDEGR